MNNSRIVTAPDIDLDARFKVLLVDCDWSDIERLSTSINSLNVDPTNITWECELDFMCLRQQRGLLFFSCG